MSIQSERLAEVHWVRDDAEEDLVGADWHQESIASLANGLRRISDDMHGYYMLTYIPKNEDYNGRFRQVSVKLNHSNLEVQTRKGYYAVESVGQLPVLDYEAPVIAAARNARPESNPFSFQGAALSFPAPSRPGLASRLFGRRAGLCQLRKAAVILAGEFRLSKGQVKFAQNLRCRQQVGAARAELVASGARPRREALSGPASLTPAELRTARMAAAGLSNREIAQTLFNFLDRGVRQSRIGNELTPNRTA